MKISNSFFVTRREFPKDEIAMSAKLLIKSGMILKNENGVYTYMPLGLKVLENIKKIIREEMSKLNASEVLLPSLVNSDIFKLSEREKIFGKEMFTLKDRNNVKMALCSTYEELFSYLASYKIRSYRDLHFVLYQFGNKFRDEEHPELGIVRKKEFMNASAYSYDADEGGLEVSYDKMYMTFKNIFSKLSLDTIVVESSPLNMKGITGEEFQVVSKYGDNEVVKCTNCSYSCDRESSSSSTIFTNREVPYKKLELISTPNINSIKELSEYLNIFSSNIIKCLVCLVDEEYKLILLRGQSKLNINKLKKLYRTNNVRIPSKYELLKNNINARFIGPINLDMEIIADNEVRSMHNFVCGSNKENYHYINANYPRDFKISKFADLKLFDENSVCPKCKNKCEIVKGIEVGQLFKLGKSYSEIYNLLYKNEINTKEYVHMGSYQIGLDRCIAAIVANNHDENGIIWPINVAPYKVAIVISNMNNKDSVKFANSLYDRLNDIGIDTILDDRKVTIGIKFNDMDLIGIPIRITIGDKYVEDGKVELKLRKEKETILLESNKLLEYIDCLVNKK